MGLTARHLPYALLGLLACGPTPTDLPRDAPPAASHVLRPFDEFAARAHVRLPDVDAFAVFEPAVWRLLARDAVPFEERPVPRASWMPPPDDVPVPGLRFLHYQPRYDLAVPAGDATAAASPSALDFRRPLLPSNLTHPQRELRRIDPAPIEPDTFFVCGSGVYLVLAAGEEPDDRFAPSYPAATRSVLGELAPLHGGRAARLQPAPITLGTTTRRGLWMPPGARLALRLDVPANGARLLCGVGLLARGLALREDGASLRETASASDGVGFRLVLEDGDGRRTPARATFLDPTDADRYHDLAVDLRSHAGRTVTLHVTTHGSRDAEDEGDPRHDFAVFAEPLLEVAVPAAERPPGHLLVSLDTLRADALSCYGNTRIETPHLDALARRGVLFEDVRSTTSWTLPAHASLFTSLHVTEHGTDRWYSRLPEELVTLAEVFREHGYRTAAFTGGVYLSARLGMAQGFDTFDAVDGGFEAICERALAWVADVRTPWFLFVHTYEPHGPYEAPEPFRSRYVAPYDGPLGAVVRDGDLDDETLLGGPARPADVRYAHQLYEAGVAYTDHVFGAFLERLERHAPADRTTLCVTSDHGEEFFEHGRFGHRSSLYDDQVRIPLLLWAPAAFAGGRREPLATTLIDVAPTFLELADLPLPRAWSGLSLRDTSTPRDVLLGLFTDREERHLAVCRGGHKWMTIPAGASLVAGEEREQLFDLRDDPRETRNLRDARPATTARLRQELERLLERHPDARSGDVDPLRFTPEERRALRAFGYLR